MTCRSGKTHVYNYPFSREESFIITCGASGVGSITALLLRLADRFDDWHVEWIRIDDGIDSTTFPCDVTIPGYAVWSCEP